MDAGRPYENATHSMRKFAILASWTRNLAIPALLLSLDACQKPAERATRAAPATLQEAANSPTVPRDFHPAANSTLYVVRSFSVTDDNGVQGFPPGKQVIFLKEIGEDYLITDGLARARAPKSSFTNNRDLALLAGKNGLPPLPHSPAPAARPPAIAKSATASAPQPLPNRASEQKQGPNAAKKSRLKTEIAALTKRIAAAQQEIEQKKSTQRPVRRTYDVWGNLVTYQGRSSYTLSADASGLDRLIEKKSKMADELAALEEQ